MKYKKNNIPEQSGAYIKDIFVESDKSSFGEVDTNLGSWLPEKFPATKATSFSVYKLDQHLNNQEVIDYLGGEEKIIKDYIFSPQQIKYLVELTQESDSGPMIKDGFSNLFFVFNSEENKLYFIGVVWDISISKFVPYIYRPRNLYRSWSKGNQLFIRNEF